MVGVDYVAAFMRASNAIYDVPGAVPIWKTAPIRLGVTIVTMVLLVAAAVIVLVTGGLAQKAGNALGVGSVAVTRGTSPSGRSCSSSSG